MSKRPIDLPEPIPAVPENNSHVVLDGELAAAYVEFREASADVEGKTRAAQTAQERYRNAVGRLGQLSIKDNA